MNKASSSRLPSISSLGIAFHQINERRDSFVACLYRFHQLLEKLEVVRFSSALPFYHLATASSTAPKNTFTAKACNIVLFHNALSQIPNDHVSWHSQQFQKLQNHLLSIRLLSVMRFPGAFCQLHVAENGCERRVFRRACINTTVSCSISNSAPRSPALWTFS